MDLSKLSLGFEYRSDTCNIVDDFYIPCLSNSKIYKRSVGYFTSNSLAILARGIVELIKNNGRMQIIASPHLTEEDVEAIQMGYKQREEIVKEAVIRQFENVEDEIIKKRLSYLAMLISQERLDIKIAVLKNNIQRGIYHEKIGVFQDELGNVVAFSGSANETEGGLYHNFEQIDVFCTWKPGESERAKKKHENFEELWVNGTRNVEVLDFNDAVEEELVKFKSYYADIDPESTVAEEKTPYAVTPKKKDLDVPFELRDYQKQAIRAWFENDGSGIYEMATGTGKTITALSTAVYWYKRSKKIALIIVCPYSHLVEQWAEEARNFNFDPILAYESRKKWEGELNRLILAFNLGSIKHFCVITTNRTFISDVFQESINKIANHSMLIVDEAHHVGAAETVSKLPEQIDFRLALSATPERWMDPDGTAKIYEYFFPGVIFEFGLSEAIERGFLTEYFYHLHLIELTDEETEEYYDLTRKIVRLAGVQNESLEIEQTTGQSLKFLLIKRAKLIGRARNKTEKLYELMKDRVDSTHNIFYCGDEKVDDVRQLEEVMKMLGYELGMKVHPFTSEESMDERKRILKDFESGDIQGIVAIKCLDEGVDVPATQTAYILASSTNPREFIQRRGRILRKHPSKKYSHIHDFIVIPRNLEETRYLDPSLFNVERALIRKELTRASEFLRNAENRGEEEEKLMEVKVKYNLLDI